jgi:hypothetical protein
MGAASAAGARRDGRPVGDPSSFDGMQIVSALFIDDIAMRTLPGPATRIDLTGIQFSAAAPTELPLTWSPHLSVIVSCDADEPGAGVLEVRYLRDGDQIARNVQPLEIEPGKFNQRLVRGEIEFTDYGTVEAHCRIDQGPVTIVPYTMLPPADPPVDGA